MKVTAEQIAVGCPSTITGRYAHCCIALSIFAS
jgi:hypothetical protein